jgi:hypothetical protein
MALTLPLLLNADTIPVVLAKQLGTPLIGDAQLHLLAGMPFRVADLIPVTPAQVSTAATAAGFSTNDATTLSNELTKRQSGKKHD